MDIGERILLEIHHRVVYKILVRKTGGNTLTVWLESVFREKHVSGTQNSRRTLYVRLCKANAKTVDKISNDAKS